MATITIEYGNNPVVLSTIKRWCTRGLVKIMQPTVEQTQEVAHEWTEAEEREAFLYTSKVNAAKNFAHLL